VTAPWLDLELPMALAEPAAATLEVRQTKVKQMEEGARYEYEYDWKLRGRGTPPKDVGVTIIGAKDIRVIDMKSGSGMMSGTFAVTTTKATDPARYDLYINADWGRTMGRIDCVAPHSIRCERRCHECCAKSTVVFGACWSWQAWRPRPMRPR